MAYYDYNSDKESEKAVWNIDDEILKIIKDLKVVFLRNLKEWRLEDAYWILDLICMECDAKLKPKEQMEIEEELIKLENNRKDFTTNGKNKTGEFYINLRNLYKKINRLMKDHGVWFREMEDDVGL